MSHLFFGILAVLVTISDFVLAGFIYRKRKESDIYFGNTILFSGIAGLSYFLSTVPTNYFLVSLFSSFYFCSMSILLVNFLFYIIDYTKIKEAKHRKIIMIISLIVCCIDVIIELLNPFTHIAIDFIFRENSVAMWQYSPKLLYKLHLIYCYILIAIIFAYLIYRIIKTPVAYRVKYLSVLFGVLFVVVLNGIFLYFQNEDMLDYSTLFYSLIGFFILWNRYYYSTHGMLSRVRQIILNEIDQPVLLFDDEDQLAMSNALGTEFIPTNRSNEKYPVTLKEFAYSCAFPQDITNFKDNIHFQWNYSSEERQSIYRVDIKRLRDKKDRTIGKLLVMTDTSLEMDLLTGFHSKNSFEGFFSKENNQLKYPVTVTICDLNKLSQINRQYGEENGDLAVQQLARLMTLNFPKDTYFARLVDANLLAVCPNTDTDQIRVCIENLKKDLHQITSFGTGLEMQSAIASATEEKPSIIDAAETALFSMRSKKLMDGGSSHSSLLDSLAQTLLESDDTTRAHVDRTRNMGEMLGKRLNFSDIQLSNLALLCLLHDIGKLGIPLEILNKPGKLNNAEWEVMKSHVEKGYRIAKASSELEEIADLILHHHESWNGKGYPDGLKGESIPLLSRVIAVVDTYDAMTNDRPYHQAISDAEARAELKRCAGVQFDPAIVSEFLNLLEELHPLNNAEDNTAIESSDTTAMGRQNSNEIQNQTTLGLSEIFSEEQKPEITTVLPISHARYTLDETGKILSINKEFEELTGYTQEDLKKYNLTHIDLLIQDDVDSYMSIIQDLTPKSESGEVFLEHRIVRKDGSKRNVICLGKALFDSVTRKPKVEILVFDITETKAYVTMQKLERKSAQRSIEKWENLTRKDSLTGLLNHEAFINDVEKELLEKKHNIVLMILDVDNFKSFNDSYGHLAGDRILTLVAIMLETSVKEYGFAGRLGGDEFAAILKVPKNFTQEQIDKLVSNSFNTVMNSTTSQEQMASVSIGAAYLESETEGFNKLYQKADAALYRAKEKGRKCYSF